MIDEDDDELEVEYPEAARCPFGPEVVLSRVVIYEVELDLLGDAVVVGLLVQIDADILDCDVHLVNPEVEIGDDHLLDDALVQSSRRECVQGLLRFEQFQTKGH